MHVPGVRNKTHWLCLRWLIISVLISGAVWQVRPTKTSPRQLFRAPASHRRRGPAPYVTAHISAGPTRRVKPTPATVQSAGAVPSPPLPPCLAHYRGAIKRARRRHASKKRAEWSPLCGGPASWWRAARRAARPAVTRAPVARWTRQSGDGLPELAGCVTRRPSRAANWA